MIPNDAGHRRLLEHLSDPACPSIRRFVENFLDDGGKSSATSAGRLKNGKGEHNRSSESNGKTNLQAEDEILGTGDALREAYNACLQALYDFR